MLTERELWAKADDTEGATNGQRLHEEIQGFSCELHSDSIHAATTINHKNKMKIFPLQKF